jgi:phospholipid/cholesterol/gamma-HCH transport system ATP-binding protein
VALAAVELKNVTVKFDSHTVLKNVNFSLENQESIIFIGPSGHGKSVLLKVMAGLLNPSEGEVLIRGENILNLSSEKKKALSRSMGMLFQKNALFDSMTCGENIAFPLREVTQKTEAEISETVKVFLEAVGILHAKDLFPDEISGGMQKRLGIARALALNPEIIYYDDPTAGLDPITSRKIVDLISALKKHNRSSVAAVTNDMNRAYQMADRIFMVLNQNVICTGSPEETKKSKDPSVQQFIFGKIQGPLTFLSEME